MFIKLPAGGTATERPHGNADNSSRRPHRTFQQQHALGHFSTFARKQFNDSYWNSSKSFIKRLTLFECFVKPFCLLTNDCNPDRYCDPWEPSYQQHLEHLISCGWFIFIQHALQEWWFRVDSLDMLLFFSPHIYLRDNANLNLRAQLKPLRTYLSVELRTFWYLVSYIYPTRSLVIQSRFT